MAQQSFVFVPRTFCTEATHRHSANQQVLLVLASDNEAEPQGFCLLLPRRLRPQ